MSAYLRLLRRIAIVCAASAPAAGLPAARADIRPLVGTYSTLKVKRGETLQRIARREDVNAELLARLNNLRNGRVRPGQRLTMPVLHVLPRQPAEGIVLNIPERNVYLFRNGQIKAVYPVAVGKKDWPTEIGTFKLASKEINPRWKPTKEMVEREDIKDDVVPPGKDNPVGDRWMGWSKKGFGFHSTVAPDSVGKVISHGCVRLYPESAHKMFDLVREGETIYSIYEPITIGRRDNKYFLSVYPDVYHKNLVSLARAKAMLQKDGLLSRVNINEVARLVRKQQGYPVALHLRGKPPASRPESSKSHGPAARQIPAVAHAANNSRTKPAAKPHAAQAPAKHVAKPHAVSPEPHGAQAKPAANAHGAQAKPSAKPYHTQNKPGAGAKPHGSPRKPQPGAKLQGAQRMPRPAVNAQAKPGAGNGSVPAAVALSPEEVAAARAQGALLLARIRTGHVRLLNQERDLSQLQQLAKQGYLIGADQKPVPLAPALRQALARLANRTTAAKPLVLLSLYRPLTAARPREPHGRGLAADIASFGGHSIDNRNPAEAAAGVIAILMALPPGEYRLGLPKPPRSDPWAFLPPPPRPARWPFFPAPLADVGQIGAVTFVMPRIRNGAPVRDAQGRCQPAILRWENERGAPWSDLGEPRLRRTLAACESSHVRVLATFPDAADHLHLDVSPVVMRGPVRE